MFNLSVNKSLEIRKRAIYCLVIYDIPINKRRVVLSNLLEGYGARVQMSCFEIKVTRSQYRQLQQEIHSFYDSDKGDNIIIYHITDEKIKRYNEEYIHFDDDLIIL